MNVQELLFIPKREYKWSVTNQKYKYPPSKINISMHGMCPQPGTACHCYSYSCSFLLAIRSLFKGTVPRFFDTLGQSDKQKPINIDRDILVNFSLNDWQA